MGKARVGSGLREWELVVVWLDERAGWRLCVIAGNTRYHPPVKRMGLRCHFLPGASETIVQGQLEIYLKRRLEAINIVLAESKYS